MTSEQQIMLAFVTGQMWEIDRDLKAYETSKAAARKAFFDLIDEILIEEGLATSKEEASQMKFSYVNEKLGKVFGRNIAMVGESFRINDFVENYPDLAERCVSSRVVYELDEERAKQILNEDPSLLAVFQDCTTEGRPQQRLATVRNVTEVDLV